MTKPHCPDIAFTQLLQNHCKPDALLAHNYCKCENTKRRSKKPTIHLPCTKSVWCQTVPRSYHLVVKMRAWPQLTTLPQQLACIMQNCHQLVNCHAKLCCCFSDTASLYQHILLCQFTVRVLHSNNSSLLSLLWPSVMGNYTKMAGCKSLLINAHGRL